MLLERLSCRDVVDNSHSHRASAISVFLAKQENLPDKKVIE
jgi:hypothetical protein